MVKRNILFLLLISICIIAAGCATTLTPLQRRAIESRDLRSSYENAYRAILTVLQDKNFSITNSDYQGGVIRATTGKQFSRTLITGILADLFDISKGAYNTFDISITLEKYTEDISKVRIVLTQHMYDENSYHISSRRIENPEKLQEYYALIQKEIFVRERLENK